MVDRYKDFSDLAKGALEARDYRIRLRRCPGTTAIIAIHGGGIEPGTSEIAEAIAGDELSFYAFEGIKSTDNGELHITSHNFDEAECVALVTESSTVVSIHGEDSKRQVVFLGGLDGKMQTALGRSLASRGFVVEAHTDRNLRGLAARNICNRGRNGFGTQLELSKGLRRSFFKSLSKSGRLTSTEHFHLFVKAVRDVVV